VCHAEASFKATGGIEGMRADFTASGVHSTPLTDEEIVARDGG
jgi:hypothetical protein